MSKTVIVFSTYFITPNIEYLFQKEAVGEPNLFDSDGIKDFFRRRLTHDPNYASRYLVDCVIDPGVLSESNQQPNTYSKKDDIEFFLRKRGLSPKEFDINPDDPRALFLQLIRGKHADIAKSFKENFIDTGNKTEVPDPLNGLSVDSLLEQLKSTQPPFDLYSLEKTNRSEPWLRHRFSYYVLKQEEGSDIAVYAIWALATPANQEEWIGVLTEQFKKLNPDLESLYLILHDKDFGLSSFTIVEPKHQISDGGKEFRRTVAVFSHVDEIGKRILGKRGLTTTEVFKSIQEIVENKQKRGYLFSLVRCLASGSDDTVIDEFLDKIKGIDEDYYSKVKSITDSVKKDNGSKNVAENIYEALYKMNVLIGEFENSNNSQP